MLLGREDILHACRALGTETPPPSTHASACSGDDIANVCNEAAHNVLRRELAGRCAGCETKRTCTPLGVD